MDDVRIYLKYYGNYTFSEEPFNDVDNIVLSFLSYINFEGIVPTYGNGSIRLCDASRLYWSKYSKEENDINIIMVRKAAYVLKKIENSKRYGDILLYNYIYKVDHQSQFGAVCCKMPDGSLYVSYEGTDSSISGWEEDFKLAYMFPTLAQTEAIDYLNKVIKFDDRNIMVGGHSKGGNLALVASMYCKPRIRKRIKCIYNNDGPGLRKMEFESKNYQEIYPKLKTFVPEHSLVGMLLRHSPNYTVVSSSARGLLQHDATSWCCYGGHFVTGKISKASRNYEISILNWLNKYDDKKRESFIKSLFDVFRDAQITDLKELKVSTLKGVIKLLSSTKNLESETRDMLLDFMKAIISEL